MQRFSYYATNDTIDSLSCIMITYNTEKYEMPTSRAYSLILASNLLTVGKLFCARYEQGHNCTYS